MTRGELRKIFWDEFEKMLPAGEVDVRNGALTTTLQFENGKVSLRIRERERERTLPLTPSEGGGN